MYLPISKKTNTLAPFGIKDKLGYLFGDFGNDFTFILSTMILTKFYTDAMGVSAGIVGTIMMLARSGLRTAGFGSVVLVSPAQEAG